MIVAASCGTEQQPSLEKSGSPLTSGAPTLDELRSIFDCPKCEGLNAVPLYLPHSGVEAYSAKLRDPLSGAAFVATVRADRSPVNERDLLAAERAAYAAKYGKLHENLAKSATAAKRGTKLPIRIAATMSPPIADKASGIAAEAAFMSAHRANVSAATAPIDAWVLAHGGEVTYKSPDVPYVDAEVDASEVGGLSSLPFVQGVALRSPEVPASFNWHTAVRAAAAKSAGATGSGTRICVLESSQPLYPTLFALEATRTSYVGGSGDHTQNVMGVIQDTVGNTYTIATGALLNLSNANLNGTTNGDMDWCLSTRSAPIVNMSKSAITSGGVDEWELDYRVKIPPYPLIAAAAGNSVDPNPSTTFLYGWHQVKNRSYNTMIVGAAADRDFTASLDNDYMMDQNVHPPNPETPPSMFGSSWLNPTTTHGDYELPHLVAHGEWIGVQGSGMSAGSSGTSFATPQVAAVAALMRTRDTSFGGWPELLRAALLATSVKTLSDQPAFTYLSAYYGGSGGKTDVRQGAGMLNANLAYDIAAPANFRAPGTTAAGKGRYPMTLALTGSNWNATTNRSTFAWNIAIESGMTRLRVAIAWDGTGTGTVGGSGSTTLDADLDLEVVNSSGTVVCNSTTYDGSWEACDLAVSAGQTYTARLVRWSNSASSTYFGIAWYNYNPSSI